MSGYIPHDDDVEMAYIHGASQDYPVAARADALRAEFDRWLAKHDRDVKAEAWDEGWDAGEGEAYEHEARLQWSMPHTCAKNPYREQTK